MERASGFSRPAITTYIGGEVRVLYLNAEDEPAEVGPRFSAGSRDLGYFVQEQARQRLAELDPTVAASTDPIVEELRELLDTASPLDQEDHL